MSFISNQSLEKPYAYNKIMDQMRMEPNSNQKQNNYPANQLPQNLLVSHDHSVSHNNAMGQTHKEQPRQIDLDPYNNGKDKASNREAVNKNRTNKNNNNDAGNSGILTKVWNTVISDLERCGSQSSSHGWSHGWSTPSLKKRFFWLSVTCISAICLVFFIKTRVNDFLNSGVATSFSYEHAEENGVPLPQFTLCAMNSVDDTEFYKDVLQVEQKFFTIIEEIIEVRNEDATEEEKAKKSDLGYAALEFLWRRISADVVAPFWDIPARIHNRFYFSKLMAETYYFDRILHGVDSNPCLQEQTRYNIIKNDASSYPNQEQEAKEKMEECYVCRVYKICF